MKFTQIYVRGRRNGIRTHVASTVILKENAVAPSVRLKIIGRKSPAPCWIASICMWKCR